MAEILQWNDDAILLKAQLISYAYIDHLTDILKKKIAEERPVNWPVETRRRNKTVAGSSRDIVDTGRLQLSLSVRKRQDGGVFTWDAPYALNVVLGQYGKAKRPARDWRQWAVDESPLPVFFLAEWRRLGVQPPRTYT